MKEIDDIKPGVAVVMLDQKGSVLLQKRADVKRWGIPSGHVEPGETVSQAAIREVKEETGLDISLTRLIGVYSDPLSQVFHYPNGKRVHFITTCFLAKVIGGEVSLDSPETLDIQWFAYEKLPKDLLNMHPKWLIDARFQNAAVVR